MLPARERAIERAAVADLQQRHLLLRIEPVMPENRPRDEVVGAAEDADADGFAFEVGDLFVSGGCADQVHLRFEHRVDADQRRAGDRRPQGAAHWRWNNRRRRSSVLWRRCW